jgi:hypothetical protein
MFYKHRLEGFNMALSTIRLVGINTKGITDDEILELAENADYVGEKPKGFIKLILKDSGTAHNGVGYYGFQGLNVQAVDVGGAVETRASVDTDYQGNPASKSKAIFTSNRLGVNSTVIPNTKHNLDRLVKVEAGSTGSPWTISDSQIKAEVNKKANAIRKEREEREEAAEKQAVEEIHTERATTIKALKDIYKDAYQDIREYKDEILPLIAKRKKEIIRNKK